MAKHSQKAFVKAAGGLIWRESSRGRQLLVVHRPLYDDWSLPKGKLEPGESWPEAARREVAEETGYSTIIDDFAGVTTYYHGRRPKVVLFWNMHVSGPPGPQPATEEDLSEVDEMLWLDASEAVKRLTYALEQALVAENLARRG